MPDATTPDATTILSRLEGLLSGGRGSYREREDLDDPDEPAPRGKVPAEELAASRRQVRELKAEMGKLRESVAGLEAGHKSALTALQAEFAQQTARRESFWQEEIGLSKEIADPTERALVRQTFDATPKDKRPATLPEYIQATRDAAKDPEKRKAIPRHLLAILATEEDTETRHEEEPEPEARPSVSISTDPTRKGVQRQRGGGAVEVKGKTLGEMIENARKVDATRHRG